MATDLVLFEQALILANNSQASPLVRSKVIALCKLYIYRRIWPLACSPSSALPRNFSPNPSPKRRPVNPSVKKSAPVPYCQA